MEQKKQGHVVETNTVKFVQQCQLELFPEKEASFTSNIRRRYQLINCSNRFGYIFTANPTTKALVVFQSKRIQPSAASKATRASTILNSESVGAKRIGLSAYLSDVSHLLLSDDELTLVVCGTDVNGKVPSAYFFSVVELIGGTSITPFSHIQLTKNPNAVITSITARPMADAPTASNAETDIPSALALFSDGSLCHFSLSKSPAILGSLPSDANCVSWSRKGKQFVVGDKTGRLLRFEPAGMKQKGSIAAPGPNLAVCDVLWLDNYNYAVAYLATDGSNPQPQVFFVTSRSEPAIFTEFGDICYGTDDDMSHPRQYFFEHVHEWRLVLALSQTALEGSLLSYNQAEASWEQLLVADETARLTFPADPDLLAYPVGMVLSFSAQHPAVIPPTLVDDPQAFAKTPPSPLLLISTSSGNVSAYSVVNLAPDAVNLTKEAVPLPGGVQMQPLLMPAAKPLTPATQPTTAPPPQAAIPSVLQQQQDLFQKQQQQSPVKAISAIAPPPVASQSQPAFGGLFAKAPTPGPAIPTSTPAVVTNNPSTPIQPQKPATPVPQIQKVEQSKAEMDKELDEFVASKLGEEIDSLNQLYNVWSKTVKPLLDKEQDFKTQAEKDSQHFARVLSDINNQLDSYRASLSDLEGGFKLLSARLVDGLARAEEIRLTVEGPSSPVKGARIATSYSHHLALSPKRPSLAAASIVSPHIRERLKHTSHTISQQLFASCGQQLTRLREMNKSLDYIYDALVAHSHSDPSKQEATQVKNIYEAAYGLQKAVHLQKLFVAELHKKVGKLKQQASLGANDLTNKPVVTNAVVRSLVRIQSREDQKDSVKLSRYLMNHHRLNCINVAPQPSFADVGKTLPKPPPMQTKLTQEALGKSVGMPKAEITPPSKSSSFAQQSVIVESSKPKTAEQNNRPLEITSKQAVPPNVNLFSQQSSPSVAMPGNVVSTQNQPLSLTATKPDAKISAPPMPKSEPLPKPDKPATTAASMPSVFTQPQTGATSTGLAPNASPFATGGILFKAPTPSVAAEATPPAISIAPTKNTFSLAAATSASPSPTALGFSAPPVQKIVDSAETKKPEKSSSEPVASVSAAEPVKPSPALTNLLSDDKKVIAPATVGTSGPSSLFPVPGQTNVSTAPAATGAATLFGSLSNTQTSISTAAPSSTSPAPVVFGFPNANASTAAPSITTPSFVTSPAAAAPVASSSGFGLPASTTANSTSSVFSFAAPSATAPKPASVLPSNIPVPVSTSASTNIFGAVTTTNATSPVQGSNLFTAPTPSAAPGFSFATPATTTSSSTGFSFAAPATTAATSAFSFSAPVPSTASSNTSSAFSFAPPASSTSNTSSTSGGSVFSFAAPAVSSASQSSNLFGQTSSSAAAAAAPANAEPLFGGMFASSLSDFGKAVPDKPSSSGPFGGFGAVPTSVASSGGSGLFGGTNSVSQPPSTPSTGFSFAPSGGATATKPSGGLFGSSSLAPATPSTGFSFGSSASFGQQQPASSPAAGFGSAPAFGGSPAFGGAPAFGTAPGFGASPAFGSAPTFGGATPQTTFGGFGGAASSTAASIFGGGGGGTSGFAALASTGTGAFGGGGSSPSVPSFTQHRG